MYMVQCTPEMVCLKVGECVHSSCPGGFIYPATMIRIAQAIEIIPGRTKERSFISGLVGTWRCRILGEEAILS